MKFSTLIFSLFFLTTITLISCNKEKDYTNPEDLVDTTWIYENNDADIYDYEIKSSTMNVTSTNSLDLTFNYEFQTRFYIGTYSIENAVLMIQIDKTTNMLSEDIAISGSINGTKITLVNDDFGVLEHSLK